MVESLRDVKWMMCQLRDEQKQGVPSPYTRRTKEEWSVPAREWDYEGKAARDATQRTGRNILVSSF